MNRSGQGILSVIFILCCLALSVGSLSALENTFTITADVSNQDATPPSTPTNLSATPASAQQIDLTWNASTDDNAVAGYRIYREGVIVATSTVNSYSDIGLFPSTQYAYNVDAFDASLNFSSTSATTSATTPASPSTSPRRSTSSSRIDGDTAAIQVYVFPHTTSAILLWDTEQYTRANVYWGQSADYESGVISGVIFQKNHFVKLENLPSDTQHFFRIELESNDGTATVYEGSFATLKDVAVSLPQSIVLKYTTTDSSIKLSWSVPEDEVVQVRLVRSDKFFPVDPYDGKVLYQGTRQNEYNDSTAEEGITYYYALFVIDENEHYSAPSIVKAQRGKTDKPIFSNIPYSASYESALKDVGLDDFDFIQKGTKLSFSDGGLKLLPDASAEVQINAEKIPLGIKTIGIVFTPSKPQAEAATFLLTYSKEKDKYIGIIPPLDAGQTYEVEITIFDTFNNKVKTLSIAAYVDAKFQGVETSNVFLRALWFVIDHYIFAIILLLIGFLIGFMARRL